MTQIVKPNSSTLFQAHGGKLFPLSHRRAGGERELNAGIDRRDGRDPSLVVIASLGPSAQFQPRIIGFAILEIVLQDWPRARLPIRIRDYFRHGAIAGGDFQPRDQLRAFAITLAFLGEAHLAAIPAFAEDRSERILALPQDAGHVIDLVLDPLLVFGPARGEDHVADATAVNLRLVKAQRGDDEPGVLNWPCHYEGLAKVRRRRMRARSARNGRGDPLRGAKFRIHRASVYIFCSAAKPSFTHSASVA